MRNPPEGARRYSTDDGFHSVGDREARPRVASAFLTTSLSFDLATTIPDLMDGAPTYPCSVRMLFVFMKIHEGCGGKIFLPLDLAAESS